MGERSGRGHVVSSIRRLVVVFAMAIAPIAQAATTITAVHATDMGAATKSYDKHSAHFKELLNPLDSDQFNTLAQKRVELAVGSETRVTVSSRYTLSFSDTEVQSDGHVKSTVHVYGLPRNAKEPVEMLEITVRLAPDKPVMIRGLPMEQGEIVVFLNLD